MLKADCVLSTPPTNTPAINRDELENESRINDRRFWGLLRI